MKWYHAGHCIFLAWQSKANNLIKTTHWKALIFMKRYINQPLNPNDDSHLKVIVVHVKILTNKEPKTKCRKYRPIIDYLS